MKKFYKDNQTLINIIGLIASILTIIGFFIVSGNTTNNNTSFTNTSVNGDVNIDNSVNETTNTKTITDSFKDINNSTININ